MSAVQARCPACPTASPNENDDKKEDKEDSEDKHTTKHKHDDEEKTEGPWDFPNYEPFTIPPHWDRHCVQDHTWCRWFIGKLVNALLVNQIFTGLTEPKIATDVRNHIFFSVCNQNWSCLDKELKEKQKGLMREYIEGKILGTTSGPPTTVIFAGICALVVLLCTLFALYLLCCTNPKKSKRGGKSSVRTAKSSKAKSKKSGAVSSKKSSHNSKKSSKAGRRKSDKSGKKSSATKKSSKKSHKTNKSKSKRKSSKKSSSAGRKRMGGYKK